MVEITTPQALRLFEELRVTKARVLNDGSGLAEWTFTGGLLLVITADESWRLGVEPRAELTTTQEDGE